MMATPKNIDKDKLLQWIGLMKAETIQKRLDAENLESELRYLQEKIEEGKFDPNPLT